MGRAKADGSAASPPTRTACSWKSLLKKTTLILKLILAFATAGVLSAQVTVSPTSLTFSALAGSSALSQAVTVSGGSGVLFAIGSQPWLKVCSGAGCAAQNSTQINNGALTVFAD